MAKRVLIGGGTGFIGKQLGHLLLSNGYTVTNISRKPAPDNMSWQDLLDHGLPAETHAVVNLAGQNIMDFTERWSQSFKQSIEVSRINTTQMLSSTINKSHDKPKALVVVTGVAAYKPSETVDYDENSPSTGTDFFSNLCARWEEAVKVVPPVRPVIIRSGVVLGRTGGMIKSMYLPFSLGLGGPIGSGKQYLPWIHVEDLTRLILFALEDHKVTGILNGVAPQIVTNKQFTDAFARALHRPAFISAPEQILNFALNPERAMIMTTGQKVHPRRTLESGFKYRYTDINSACQALAGNKPTNLKYPIK